MNKLSHTFGQLRSLLEWPSSKKAQFVLALLFFEQTLYWWSLQFAANLSDAFLYFDIVQLDRKSTNFLILLGITFFSYLCIPFLKKVWGETPFYEHLAAQNFGLSHVYYGYTIGLLSLPAGVVLAAAPVVGFIFLNRKAVLLAYATGLMEFIAILYATLSGTIDYAPLATNITGPDGQLLPIWMAIYGFFAAPHLLSLFAIAYYILKLWRERENEVQRLSYTDSLTELLNRRSIMVNLKKVWKQCQLTNKPFSVLMIDLDHFKQINDSWGHDIGDQVLKHAANILKKSVRQLDYVGRYGGEEFLIILPELDSEAAAKIADRIRQTLASEPTKTDKGESLLITMSQGLSHFQPGSTLNAEEVIQSADQALYEAKAKGRNQLVIATD